MDQVDQHVEFHRLARSWPRYSWWKPLVTGLLGLAIYLAFTVVLILAVVLIALATSADVQQYLEPAAAIDLGDPVIFAFTLASLILLIPALVLATLIMGPKPIGLLSSVTGRIRWRWLGLCTLVSVGIYAVSLAVSSIIGILFPSDAPPIPQPDTSTTVILLAMTLLAVPFQAAAEEYVFRGYLMQLVGGWLKHPAFAILLPVPLFVLGHLYDVLGQIDIAIFAIFAGWITWRTGGLEAAIAVHAINNMTIFALGAFGLADVNASEGSIGALVVSVLTMGITAFVLVKLADRRGIERTRAVTPAPPPLTPARQGAATFPAGDGVWHQAPPAQVPGAGQFGGLHTPGQEAPAPGQHDPGQYESSQYRASQQELPRYEPSRYDGTSENRSPFGGSRDRTPEPENTGGPTAARPVEFVPVPRTPARTTDGGTASTGYPTGEGYPAGTGYPTGTGYPVGQGYPTGQGHPAGTGHPAARPKSDHDGGSEKDQRDGDPGAS